jgi:hypothetical protein
VGGEDVERAADAEWPALSCVEGVVFVAVVSAW